MPAVSVIIPAYNRLHMLPAAIESVLAQTFQDLEIIVIDDGSTDNTTAALINQFGPRIRILTFPENRGRSAARNAGWAAATGEFVAFLDSDDLWQPEKLARQIPHFADKNVVLVHCWAAVIDHNNNPLPAQSAELEAAFRAALARGYDYAGITETWCRMYTSACVLRRSLLPQIGGFDPALSNFEDWDVLWRAALVGRVATVAEPLLLYRSHAGNTSVTTTWPRAATPWLIVNHKHLAAVHGQWRHRRARHNLCLNIALGEYWRRNLGASRYWMLRALALSPRPLLRPAYHVHAAPLLHALLPAAIAAKIITHFHCQNYDDPRPVTLAIDDGPTHATPHLLDTLEGAGHRAVLFVIGFNIDDREPLLINAIQRGFALGNHSETHPRFSEISIDEARHEIETADSRIDSLYRRAGRPRPAKWFRFPYLDDGGPNAPALQSLLRELGFQPHPSSPTTIHWPTSCNTADWRLPAVADYCAALANAAPGGIIELHDKPEINATYTPHLLHQLAAASLRGAIPTP